jgi:hypothetical protein
MHESVQFFSKKFIVVGAAFFWLNIGLAYFLYPHWVAFSIFGARWRPLAPYVLAMATSMAMLWIIATSLRAHAAFRLAGNTLLFAAICVGLIVAVPFRGSGGQKATHDILALLFAFSVAFGVVRMAWVTRSLLLWTLGLVQYLVCALELLFFAIYKAHPVQPWVWTGLEAVFTAAFMVSLYLLASSNSVKRHLTPADRWRF